MYLDVFKLLHSNTIMSVPERKRSQIDLMREIIKVLSKHKELSISRISYYLGSAYRSVEPALEFFKFSKMVKEREVMIKKTRNRLFSLVRKG